MLLSINLILMDQQLMVYLQVGGVLRDGIGSVIFSFSKFFGAGSNIMAEALAILTGLQISQSRKIMVSCVETDSLIMVQVLSQSVSTPWSLVYICREIQSIIGSNTQIVHAYREANQVADRLAAAAYSHSSTVIYDSLGSLLPEAANACFQDVHGLPIHRS